MYISNIRITAQDLLGVVSGITNTTDFGKVKNIINAKVVSFVHAIGDYVVRYAELLSEDEKNYFLAFHYVNNQLKHDKKLEVIYYRVYSASYPRAYPYRYGRSGVSWANFEDHEIRGKKLRKYYDMYLKEKDIQSSVEIILNILNKYHETQL